MAAESRVNGGTSRFFGNTVESLRSHINYTLRPHVDEIFRSVANLARAEQAELGRKLEPATAATRRASIALGAALVMAVFTAVFLGCALVAIIVLTVEEYRVAALLGAGVLLVGCAAGLIMYFVRALKTAKIEFSRVGEHYTKQYTGEVQ